MYESVLNEVNEECWLVCLDEMMHAILGVMIYLLWMCFVYGGFKGVLISSNSMGCYS